MIEWLVKEIADRCAERAREDEGRPEERGAGDLCTVIKQRNDRQKAREEPRAAEITKGRFIRDPVAERGAERLGDGDRGPVEHLGARR